MLTEIKIKHHYAHVSQDFMKVKEFVLIVLINVKNVLQRQSVLYVLETENPYLLVIVHMENTMLMVKLTALLVVINVKLVLMNGHVPSVMDQTEIQHPIVTVLQDIMKTQLI
jgi:hypothetical protein